MVVNLNVFKTIGIFGVIGTQVTILQCISMHITSRNLIAHYTGVRY